MKLIWNVRDIKGKEIGFSIKFKGFLSVKHLLNLIKFFLARWENVWIFGLHPSSSGSSWFLSSFYDWWILYLSNFFRIFLRGCDLWLHHLLFSFIRSLSSHSGLLAFSRILDFPNWLLFIFIISCCWFTSLSGTFSSLLLSCLRFLLMSKRSCIFVLMRSLLYFDWFIPIRFLILLPLFMFGFFSDWS